MAFFDKLKEKVNKVVDIDKLSEMANKTVDSVKREVAKAVDPSIKEQERLEKEKALKEQEEKKRQEKEQAIADFFSSIELNKELDYIFAILEKSEASVSNFEKGIEHLLSKTETAFTKEEVLPILKKELLTRAFADTESSIAKVIVTNYFIREIVNNKLLTLYMSFAISRERGSSFASMEEPFIKALYGVAGHAANFLHNRLGQKNYHQMTPDDFILIIENSDVLKSYTDQDPFAANEERKNWAQELYNSPLEIVQSSNLSSMLDKEEHVDALYYFAYTTLCQEDSAENVGVADITNVYLEYLKKYYNRIKH